MKKAVIVDDHPVIWDYAQSCLEPCYEVVECCATTAEAEEAFRKHKPDIVWLDCYLGELYEDGHGLKNSGLMLANWMKKHRPEIKVFLFTASNEVSILEASKNIGVEGIAVGGKYFKEKEVVRDAIQTIADGGYWVSPNLIDNVQLDQLGKLTVFEFCVVCSMFAGKSTGQVADEFDTTRKRINNSLYRIKEKLKLDFDINRSEFLECMRDFFNDNINLNQNYVISDIVSINSLAESFLKPVISRVASGELKRVSLNEYFTEQS